MLEKCKGKRLYFSWVPISYLEPSFHFKTCLIVPRKSFASILHWVCLTIPGDRRSLHSSCL
ncbi:hypothetical protein NC651_012060 [Populus alba x Populus x berolinensis]|nr:hypothetical protein NC651_012060 [Populus alba x Populus x berolinensis]